MSVELKKTKKELIYQLVLVLTFVFFGVRYFFSDSLQVYDAPGHIQLVWNLKENLWPFFWGWNSFSLLGFDQGIYYPPAFHYLAAFLSFFLGIENSLKIIIFSAIAVLPLSVYFFVSQFFHNERARILISSLLLSLLLITPGYLGAGVKSLTQIGLLTSFVATPLLLFYLGLLFSKPETNDFWKTLLLSLVILTHFVAGLVSVLVLLVFLKVKFLNRNLNWKILQHAFLASLITFFFWFPLLLRWGETSTSLHLPSLFLPNLLALFLALLSAFIFWKAKKDSLLVLSVVVAFLSFVFLIDWISLNYWPENSLTKKIYSFHLYRYQVYSYLFLLLILLFWPVNFLFNLKKPKIKPFLVETLALLVTLFLITFRSGLIERTATIKLDQGNLNQGRFLETYSREESFPFVYSAQVKLVLEEKQSWAYGLFTDANKNGPFIGSLISTLKDTKTQASKSTFSLENKKIDLKKTASVLDLFAISNLVYLYPQQPKELEKKNFFTLGLNKKEFVSVPNQKLVFVEKEWEKNLANWWLKEGPLDTLLIKGKKVDVNTNLSMPSPVIVKNNKNWSDFVIDTKSDREAPLLVKFSHSPNWQAWDESGRSVPILTASPNLMLVVAKGQIHFRYQTLWYQKLAFSVSFFALLIWLFFFTGKRNVSEK